MAFADPTSITIAGATVPLNRTGSGVGVGEFRDADGTVYLSVRHSVTNKGRSRDEIRLRKEKIAADPLVTTVNRPYSMSVSILVDAEKAFTTTERKDQAVGLVTLLTANSNALLLKLLGGEQ